MVKKNKEKEEVKTKVSLYTFFNNALNLQLKKKISIIKLFLSFNKHILFNIVILGF